MAPLLTQNRQKLTGSIEVVIVDVQRYCYRDGRRRRSQHFAYQHGEVLYGLSYTIK